MTKNTLWPYYRQMPVRLRGHFTLGSTAGAEFLVVYDGIAEPLWTKIPFERTLVILPEPPGVKRYNTRFLNQFGHVLTVDDRVRHPGRILGWSTMNWFYGITFTEHGLFPSLRSLDEISVDSDLSLKNRVASVIVSDKASTRGQRFRIRFVHELKGRLRGDLDVFGSGRNGRYWIPDKRDAIAPYKFHVALENDCIPHYFTEKLLDSYLGSAFPIYRGAPNLKEYFPAGSFSQIPEQLTPAEAAQFAADEIHRIDYGSQTDSIARAKSQTLLRYNMFEAIFCISQQLHRDLPHADRGGRWIEPEMKSLGSAMTNARNGLSQRIWRSILP